MTKQYPHESATLHVTGEARFTDDITEVVGTAYAALGLSEQAHATIDKMDLSGVEQSDGVLGVYTAKDIPGSNDCGPILSDDPILADGLVQFVGQPLFVVVANTIMQARRAAKKARISYSPLEITIDPEQARSKGMSVVPKMNLVRGNPESVLKQSSQKTQGKFSVGGQEQFYLESHISYAIVLEDDQLLVYCSTQHPTEMQHKVAHALNLNFNQVKVEVRRMGGGFGGKESQSALFACVCSLCAVKLQRPVKLRLDRDDDMLATGKRHCFDYAYDVAYGDDGIIQAANIDMTVRAGFSTDLTPPVATRAICHFDNAYYLSDVDISAYCAKTNTQSNTAFRGFGGPQGALAIELVMDNIARDLGKDPLDVRRLNYYGKTDNNTTPYGQVVKDNVIHELTLELEKSSDYRARREAVAEFNASSKILKKGLSLTPLKFGISFNVVHFNQAGALVHVYTDGTVLVNHGGTEMGQGIHTKIAQVVANELGLELSVVRVTATDTSKVVNTSATAASTGADLNAKAAENAANKIRNRLAVLAATHFDCDAKSVVFDGGKVKCGEQSMSFKDLVESAYLERIQLWSDGFYKTPKLSWDKDTLTGSPFYYFAYGASVSEVIVDTLTGEWKLLRADLLHDAGNSINPAIDKGQVEGAFIQGMGWLTTEELVWNDQGKLMTHAPSTYKIPSVNDCPDDLRVELFENSNHEETIMRSKAVGEPPILLAFSVFFALRDAIASVADNAYNPELNAPATPENILNAIVDLQNKMQPKNEGSL